MLALYFADHLISHKLSYQFKARLSPGASAACSSEYPLWHLKLALLKFPNLPLHSESSDDEDTTTTSAGTDSFEHLDSFIRLSSKFDQVPQFFESFGVKKMLPESYDKVSEETKKVVQLFMARARSLVRASSASDEEACRRMEPVLTGAMELGVKIAVQNWEKHRKLCSAEQFVQRFARLVWYGATGDGKYHFTTSNLPQPVHPFKMNDNSDMLSSEDPPLPCGFTAPVDEGPLSTEFLKAVGMTEEEALGHASTAPASANTTGSPSKAAGCPPAPSNQIVQAVKATPPCTGDSSALGKRKNDEPEAGARKYGRGDDGQRMPPRSPSPDDTDEPWGGVYLTDEETKLMNTDIMNVIWDTQVIGQLKTGHFAGVFQVGIPREKAWKLLGKDITTVFRLMRNWPPVRLYTYD